MTDTAIPGRTAASRTNGAARPKAEPEFGALVRETWRLMRRNFERRAREMELPLSRLQAIALLRISRQEGISQAQLANALEIQPIAVVAILDKLQSMGLIERRPAAADRRVRELWLRPAAKPMLERILGITRGIRQAAFAGFSNAQRKAFFVGLARVKENLAWLVAEEEEGVAALRRSDPSAAVKGRAARQR
jgi:MarR family transcriptional regulator for hemolysin